jgi:cleavage and polyadenylation specificity factor subunit 1
LLQIFVRAFDLDERLVGVAFLDVGVYVTTLRSLKNLLIIGDAVKSVWFVAFQVRASFIYFHLQGETFTD